jgi:hypothetical protein
MVSVVVLFHSLSRIISFILLTQTAMKKRPSPSEAGPPAKRSRLASGFRLARPPPTSQTASSSTSRTLFVTVQPRELQCGTWQAQNRLISSAPELAANPPTMNLVSGAEPCHGSDQPPAETTSPLPLAGSDDLGDAQPDAETQAGSGRQVDQGRSEPKRKRQTTNAVG